MIISTDPNMADLPKGFYPCIAADCATEFKSNSAAKPGRNVRRHYKTMTQKELMALPVADLGAENSILWFWTTGPLIVKGFHIPIMKAWGYKPTAMGFVWIKLNPNSTTLFFSLQDIFKGGGFTTRKNAEFCIIGKRGKSVREHKGIGEVIIEPRREHSRKPETFFDRVEQYSGGPRLELFARQARKNWDCWGNEVHKFASKENLEENSSSVHR